jgi:ABC-2 type transport system permease protein
MMGLALLAWTDLKLYLRNVVAVFFTLAFPPLMLLLFGSMYGNSAGAGTASLGAMDIALPGYVATLVIGSAACMGLPVELAARRQSGVLRRLRATPLPAAAVLASQLLVTLAVSSLGTSLLLVVGGLAFRTRPPADLLLLCPAFALCVVSSCAVGMAVAAVARTVRSALALSMALFYPMMFLSGGTIPVQYLPPTLQRVSSLLPMSWGVDLLHSVWLLGRWDAATSLKLLAALAAGLLIALLFGRSD